MKGHSGGCRCIRRPWPPPNWGPPEPPDVTCPACHQLVFRWRVPLEALMGTDLADEDYLYEAWNQTWLTVLGWRDNCWNPFSPEYHPSAHDLAQAAGVSLRGAMGPDSQGSRDSAQPRCVWVIVRELARVLLAIDLRPRAIRAELQTVLDPEPWPNRSLVGTSHNPGIQEYYYEHGAGARTDRRVHVWTVRWRLLLGRHVDPMGCLPPWLICYLQHALFPTSRPSVGASYGNKRDEAHIPTGLLSFFTSATSLSLGFSRPPPRLRIGGRLEAILICRATPVPLRLLPKAADVYVGHALGRGRRH